MINYKICDIVTSEEMDIRYTVFCDEQGVIKSHEQDELDEPNMSKHIVLFIDEKPAATARFYKEPDGSYHVGRIAVYKEQRGKDLGKKVVEIAHEEIKKLGGKTVLISAQIQAQGFYEKLGYKAYGDSYLEEDIPHTRMKIEL